MDQQLVSTPEKPIEIAKYCGEYGPIAYDAHCGEPIAYGFLLKNRLPDNLFRQLKREKKIIYLDTTTYGYVCHWITYDELVKKYGPITERVEGPRGGKKMIKFGTRTFISSEIVRRDWNKVDTIPNV